MAKPPHHAGRGERVTTALIWFFTCALVGLALGLFFNSSILLYTGILIGLVVAWMVDRDIIRRNTEIEEDA